MSLLDRFEDHSLQHLRESLEKANHRAPSILPALENHHYYLREAIRVLTDSRAAIGDKIPALARFLVILRMHAKAEEETLYRRLFREKSRISRLQGAVGRDEHQIATLLADEIDEIGFTLNWTENVDVKATVLANLVRNHLHEEEVEVFPHVRDLLESDELHALGEAYVEKCRNYLEDELVAFSTPIQQVGDFTSF